MAWRVDSTSWTILPALRWARCIGGPKSTRTGRNGGGFLALGPGEEGALDDAGDDGDVGLADDEADAALEGEHVAGLGAGALGEEDEGAAFLEAADGLADGADVALALADGEGVELGDEAAEELIFKQFGLGEEAGGARESDADDGGVEEALVVGDDEDAAGAGDVADAADLEV